MTTVQELLAIKAIERTKARYCRFVDTKRWEKPTYRKIEAKAPRRARECPLCREL